MAFKPKRKKRQKERRIETPAKRFSTNVKLAGSIALLVGLIASGLIWMDAHFAKAEDVHQQIEGLKTLFYGSERRGLESEKRALTREQFDLEATRQKRSLTPMESQRLKIVTEEIGRVEAEINIMRHKQERK